MKSILFTLHLKQRGKPLVECDLPGLCAEGANWQLIRGGYADCDGAQWVGVNYRLHWKPHHVQALGALRGGRPFEWQRAWR